MISHDGSNPSRLVVNGKWTLARRTTGVQRYATDLMASLDRLGVAYRLAVPGGSGLLHRTLWEQVRLPREVPAGGTLFCPANMAPLRLHRSVRLVVTVHCLRFLHHPEHYSPSFVAWYRYAIPRIIDRADTVLTVSACTAAEIESAYPAARGKLEVVRPGINPAFTPEGPREVIGPGHLLYVGQAGAAKNLAVLLQALGLTKSTAPLVLAGVSADQWAAMLRAGATGRAAPDNARSMRVVPMGHINDAGRVAALMRGARALLAPSRYESFGMPVLEAMACGTPVVASAIPAHREVIGGGGELLDPLDPGAWAETIDRLTARPAWAGAVAQRGIARARAFSWSRSAARVAEVLALPSPPGRRT